MLPKRATKSPRGSRGHMQVTDALVTDARSPPEPLLALPKTERRHALTLLSVTYGVPLVTPCAGPVTSALALQVDRFGVLARGTRLSRRVLRLPQTRGVKPIGQFGVVNQKALQGCPTKHGVPCQWLAPRKQGCVSPSPCERPPGAL